LEDLEQDQLNDMLKGAEPAPIHVPPGATKTTEGMYALVVLVSTVLIVFAVKNTAEMDEDAMLKQLQAELAM